MIAGALLIVAVMFGGGGSGAGLSNLVVQLTALVALAFHRSAFFDFFKQAPRCFAILVAVTLLLPLLQCTPLPPFVWHKLPGRELAFQSLALIGEQNDWFPFSLNVRRTAIAFLALLPPLAILILTWRFSEKDRQLLLAILIACGVFAIILGAQQLAFDNRHFMLYAQTIGSPDLQGTFANRNATGLFVDITLCALIGLLWRRSNGVLELGISGAIAALLAVGLFLTRSRSSMTLAFVPLMMLLVLFWNVRVQVVTNRSRLIALVVAALALAALTVALSSNERIQHSVSRFDSLKDARPAIWQDAKSSVLRFWPLGSGIGTFDEVFQIDESFENLTPGRAARAHNEYLETMVESGVIGPLLIAGWLMAIAAAGWANFRSKSSRGSVAAGISLFALLAFQSILDYPLRSQTLLCIAGLALGFLIPRTSVREP